MTTTSRRRKSWTLRQVLEAAKALSPAEQRLLRDELEISTQVWLIPPNTSEDAIQRGHHLAEQVRANLTSSMKGTLDETMASLRGR